MSSDARISQVPWTCDQSEWCRSRSCKSGCDFKHAKRASDGGGRVHSFCEKNQILPGDGHVLSELYPKVLDHRQVLICSDCRPEEKGWFCKGERGSGMFRKLTANDWSPVCEEAFHKLKEMLLICAVLAHPDFSRPFILSVDASLDGLGAVLSQVPAGGDKAHPIAFASKTLSKSQQRYPSYRLEFMALKWSITEKFGHWLKGHDFTVWADNNPLTHILTKPKLDAYEQRWVAKLLSYTFDLKYIPGPKNIVADALSRAPFTTSISSHLIQEPYNKLVQEAEGAQACKVHDAFRSGIQHSQSIEQYECS